MSTEPASTCKTVFGVVVTGPRAAATVIVTAILLILAAARFGFTLTLLPLAVLAVAVTLLSAVDLVTLRLPDALVFTALGLSLAAITVAALATGRAADALRHAFGGMALFFVLLLAAHLVSPRGLGFGDVKLGLLLGLHLGWAAGAGRVGQAGHGGWPAVVGSVIAALAVGCALGVAWGLAVAVARRRRPLRSQAFAFGPALSAGTLAVVLFGIDL